VSANSGQAIQGVAGETISGKISSGVLESSNVDIAQEFTNMITAQRGFQANSRIITTSDSMLEELVNLKR
jgi:flagellar hook protein FlgE